MSLVGITLKICLSSLKTILHHHVRRGYCRKPGL
jgi:hypothetical protein